MVRIGTKCQGQAGADGARHGMAHESMFYLSQLHEDVHHPHEVSPLQGGARGRPRHELLVEGGLPAAEAAHHHVLVLARQLLLHVLRAERERENDKTANKQQ